MANRKWLIGVAVLIVVTVLLIGRRLRNGEPVTVGAPSGPLTVKEIIKGDYNDPGASKDDVIFSDGSKFSDVGFSLGFVGPMTIPGLPPIFLFRSSSCPQCEPKLELVIYSTGQRSTLAVDFPEVHFLIDPESNRDVQDRVRRAVYGKCLGEKYGIIIAERSRQVDSDGTRLRIPEEWDFKTVVVEFDSKGTATYTSQQVDSFATLDALKKDPACIEISQEESHEEL